MLDTVPTGFGCCNIVLEAQLVQNTRVAVAVDKVVDIVYIRSIYKRLEALEEYTYA